MELRDKLQPCLFNREPASAGTDIYRIRLRFHQIYHQVDDAARSRCWLPGRGFALTIVGLHNRNFMRGPFTDALTRKQQERK